MATQARVSFEGNWETIGHLMALGEGVPRSRPQRSAQYQAALIFCVTAWEAYVEDVAREAAAYLSEVLPNPNSLPEVVRARLQQHAKSLRAEGLWGRYERGLPSEIWRHVFREAVEEATEGHNFNTPSGKNVKWLFTEWLGVDVTEEWSWQRFKKPGPWYRLRETIELRGEIIHRGDKPKGMHKGWVYKYGEANIRLLVKHTDEAVIAHVKRLTGADGFGASALPDVKPLPKG